MGENAVPLGGAVERNILCTEPGVAAGECCREYVSEASEQIVVTVERSADEWLAANREHISGDVVVVSVGEDVRSGAATASYTATVPEPPGPDIEGVPDAGDLSALGVTLSKHLQETATTQRECHICVDSLSGLIDANDVESVFRFLHLLTQHVAATNASAHYHLDPSAHDEHTIRTLTALFDIELGV